MARSVGGPPGQLPALCFFVAGLYRNRREDDTTEQANHTGQIVHTIERIKEPAQPQQIVIRDERPRQSIATLTVADLMQRSRAA